MIRYSSGSADYQKIMTCPHCSKTAMMQYSISDTFLGIIYEGEKRETNYFVKASQCPYCLNVILHLIDHDLKLPLKKSRHEIIADEEEANSILAYPLYSSIQLPENVPGSFAQDFIEASKVREVSSNAAGVLARRCLQRYLKEEHGYDYKQLWKSVEAYCKDKNQPKSLRKMIDTIRLAGNTGA